MVGHVEIVPFTRRRREALSAAPGHVLSRHDCAVQEEDEVEVSVSYDGFFVLFYYAWEDAPGGGFARIGCEDWELAFFPVVADWCVYCFFDVGAWLEDCRVSFYHSRTKWSGLDSRLK